MTVNSNGTRIYAAFALETATLVRLATDEWRAVMRNNCATATSRSIVDSGRHGPMSSCAMPDNDVVEIDTGITVTVFFAGQRVVLASPCARAADLYVANTDARNLRTSTGAAPDSLTNRVSRISITSSAVTNFDLNPGWPTNFVVDKTNARAQPRASAFGPSGANYYLAAFGSDRVARVDANSGNITTRIELCPTAIGSASDARNKRGPRGLALKPGAALYVLNRIANTISVIDIQNNTVAREIPSAV